MPSIAIAVIAVIVALAIAIPVTAKIATSKYQKDVESKLGNADDKARQIIDDALKAAIDAYYEQYGAEEQEAAG